MRWNACVHRLHFGSYPHPKEFWGNGVRTHVNSKGRIPSTSKILLTGGSNQRRCVSRTVSPTHYQRAIPAPVRPSDRLCGPVTRTPLRGWEFGNRSPAPPVQSYQCPLCRVIPVSFVSSHTRVLCLESYQCHLSRVIPVPFVLSHTSALCLESYISVFCLESYKCLSSRVIPVS